MGIMEPRSGRAWMPREAGHTIDTTSPLKGITDLKATSERLRS